jgi:hypothetical protein
MQVIVIFDKFGYAGARTMVDVIRVPDGSNDIEVFRGWLSERNRSEELYDYLTADARDLWGMA